jgi:transposase, IS30 family
LYTRRFTKKKRVEKTKREMIPERVSIHQRFLGAEHRTRYGHWEYDTIVSRKGCSGGVSVGVERKSRLVVATLVKSMSTFEHMEAIRSHVDVYKTLSATFDNGIENKAHRSLGIPTFFCDTYNSGQKGSVENVNKMIRRYVPKGTNFREVSQRTIDHALFLINNKPRKILKYKKALEVARECGISEPPRPYRRGFCCLQL